MVQWAASRSRRVLVVLGLSLLLNGVFVAALLVHASRSGGVHYFARQVGLESTPPLDFPAIGKQRFAALPRGARDVVFAGDSQVEYAPLPDLLTPIKQRGVAGQTVSDVRGWVGQLLRPAPRRLVLLAGTNDAARHEPSAVFGAQYSSLLDTVRRQDSQTKVVVLTIPPGTGAFAGDVRRLNEVLKKVAPQHGAEVVDIFPALATPDGELRPEFSLDGKHLTPLGYARIAGLLRRATYGL